MGQTNDHVVLYRKYRPRTLDEVVGQPQVTKPLSEALGQKKIAHAYLLTGPHGVGKTSVARILAFAVNGLQYENQLPIDIIEIDGASNRRIDEIRELKERIHVAPAQSKYKVYIIDEVHMLTKEAFNALLKTLEEPPAHAVFILATTEAHKLPATIISRTQRYGFKQIEESDLITQLENIAKKEKIKIEKVALQKIAQLADGGLRDAVSLFDQVSALGDVSLENVQSIAGIVDDQKLDSLLGAIDSGDTKSISQLLSELIESGASASLLADQLIRNTKQRELTNDKLDLIDSLLAVPSSLQPKITLEVALLRNALASNPVSEKVIEPKKQADKKPVEFAAKAEPKVKKVKKEVTEKIVEEVKPTMPSQTLPSDSWQAILESIKVKNNSLYALLRMAEPTMNNDQLHLQFTYDFHRKQADQAGNKSTILKAVHQATGKELTLSTETKARDSKNSPQNAKNDVVEKPNEESNETTESVLQAFGGGEVVKL